MLQSAVAFWIVLVGFAIGCGRSTSNLTQYQISSSSMAPTWFGPHLVAKCSECGQQSEIILEAYDPAIPTRCFSCGAVCDCTNQLHAGELHPGAVHPGEVVEIARLASTVGLKRFDVVTFSSPKLAAESTETLKRIWALPGEAVELRNGNAWIDGKPLQKNTREFASICVPFSRFPKDARSHWWLIDETKGVETRIEVAAKQGPLSLESGQRLRLRYAWPNRSLEPPAMLPGPILSDYPFNQNSTSLLQEVTDVLLAIELAKPSVAPWLVSIPSQGRLYTIRVGVDGEAKGNSVGVGQADRMVFAVCDDRLFVSTERKDYQWELSELESEVETQTTLNGSSISIATDETLTISRLLVARDQWLGPRESRVRDWKPIGNATEIEASVAGGYFVLGDNLELSIDSRDASVGRISPDRVTGQVKRLAKANGWIQELLNHAFREVSKEALLRDSHYLGLMNKAR